MSLMRDGKGLWVAGFVMAVATMAPVWAQSTPVQCVGNHSIWLPLRATEITARIGDILITCTGGTPTPAGQAVPTVDILVFLNGTYTGRTKGDLTESLLLIDEPPAAAQVPCTTDVSLCGWTGGSKGPNVFQGRVLAPNAVVFHGVPRDPTGSSAARVFRITNLRVDATGYLQPDSPVPAPVNAYISMDGFVPAGYPLQVGYVQLPMQASLRSAGGGWTIYNPNGIEFSNCTAVTKHRVANLRFSERFNSAFQKPNWTYDAVTGVAGAPDGQAALGVQYYTESGFFNPSFPATNNLNKAGLADFGTRFRADFSSLPAGATIYVSTVAVVYTNGMPAPAANGQHQARLTASEAGVFAPVAATEILEGIPVVALPVTQGTAKAVWEFVGRDANSNADVDFPVWNSFPGKTVGLGTASVRMRLGPVSTETNASDTAPVARYADAPVTLPLVTILDACPGTQYLVTTSPALLPVVVDGQTYTSPKAFPWQPGSTHTIEVAEAVPTAPGVRLSFMYWSDNGARGHRITVPDWPTAFTAEYRMQYLLNLQVVPADGGSVKTTPIPMEGYVEPDTWVQLAATINPGFSFGGFSGDVVTNELSGWVFMERPRSVKTTFIRAGPVSSTIGISPASGSSPVVQFVATYEGSKLASDLKWAQVLLAAAADGGGQPFCFVHYDVQGNAFWLYSDTYGFFRGPVAPGQVSAKLQGSACGLDAIYARTSTNGARLTVLIALLFKTAGARNIYLRTMDQVGVDTGWVQHGTFNQEVYWALPMSVSPASGSATDQLFALTFTNQYASDFFRQPLGWQQFLIGADPTGGGQPFCFVHYDRAGNGLWMYSSDVGFFLGPVTPRLGSNLLDSSACSVNTALSGLGNTPSTNGNLDVTLKLKPAMQGLKKMYMRTLDPLQIDTGWVQVGTYQVP
ncbi:hypothetical protein [Paludibaculum fermentans]|uniref:hypothetical protein n=1 Tax=Paludibaculum fermentans TaxID=1473598 RepID=UPI003EBC7692